MAIASIATPAVVIPGAVVAVASVQLDANTTSAQTVLTNTAALNVVPTHLVLRSPSVALGAAQTVTVSVAGTAVVTASTLTQSLPATTGCLIIPLATIAAAARLLVPGAVITVAFPGTNAAAGAVIQCDVLGYVVTF